MSNDHENEKFYLLVLRTLKSPSPADDLFMFQEHSRQNNLALNSLNPIQSLTVRMLKKCYACFMHLLCKLV